MLNLGFGYNTFIFCRIITNVENVENEIGSHLEEALNIIIQHCSSLEIESQKNNSNTSYKRLYQNGNWSDVECVGTRSTSGTTLSVFNIFKPSSSSDKTLNKFYESVKKLMASFFLLHSHISFSLRVDSSKLPLLQTKKVKNTILAAQQLFKYCSIIPFRGLSRHFKVKGLLITRHLEENSWFMFINSQLVESKEIFDLITPVFSNISPIQKQHFAVILNIKVGRQTFPYNTMQYRVIINVIE